MFDAVSDTRLLINVIDDIVSLKLYEFEFDSGKSPQDNKSVEYCQEYVKAPFPPEASV